MAELGAASFASSVRSGRLSGALALSPDVPRLIVDTTLNVATRGGGTAQDVVTRLETFGPGDVVGIATDEILREFPRSGEPSAEPNYLAAIEFDSPELPWALSLTAGAARALPWIALVVVPEGPGLPARIDDRPGSMLPWLMARGDELPAADETWAWAHAHAQGDASLATPAVGDGRRTLSRLLCPTRLQPNTSYLAAVVPTYRAGVLAAMRQNPSEAGDARSWRGDEDSVSLPMYHHWRFSTGAAGDFEELARQLTPLDASSIQGLGRLDLRLAPGGLGDLAAEEDLQPVRTLLVSPAEDAARDQAEATQPREDVAKALTSAIEPDGDRERMVLPPRYGEWPAGEKPLAEAPGWFRDLNLQPHHRVIARVGADVIRAQQEELVAEAQRQLGDFLVARRTRDLLRLGEMTARRVHVRSVAAVPDDRLVTSVRPALSALVTGADAALVDTMVAAGIGSSLLTGSVSRIARRAAIRAGESAVSIRMRLVSGSMEGTLQPPPELSLMPSIDVDRARFAFARAGILDQEVSGVRLEQLFALAPAAQLAEDQLITALRDKTIHIRPIADAVAPQDVAPPDVVVPDVVVPDAAGPILAPGLLEHLAQGEPLRIKKRGAGRFDAGKVDAAKIDAVHVENLEAVKADRGAARGAIPEVRVAAAPHQDEALRIALAPGLGQLRGGAREVIAAEVLAGAQVAVPALDVGFPAQLPDVLVAQRLDEAATLDIAQTVATATAGLREKAIATGLTETAATAFEDLLVDRDTVALTVAQSDGASQTLQLGVRDVVRRNLGMAVRGPVLRDLLTPDAQSRFDEAVVELGGRQLFPEGGFPAAPPRVTVAAVAAQIRPQLEVSLTYAAAAAKRFPFVIGAARPSAIELGFVPTFDAPLIGRLARSLDSWILAGADRVPPNAITLLLTNPAFIEALLAGANHEMARELLWRDIPSDPRGTVFSRFWNTPASAGGLRPMHEWGSALGRNLRADSPYLCVLVRSPLLRRYPRAVIQAAQGTIASIPGGKNFEPDPKTFRTLLFQGPIAPDLTFSVLELTEDEVRQEKPGKEWYVLLGEPVTEPKFGLDVEGSGDGAARTSRGLAWTEVTPGPALRVSDPLLADRTFDGVGWGKTSAAVARILHQDPFRLVLPASRFLKTGG